VVIPDPAPLGYFVRDVPVGSGRGRRCFVCVVAIASHLLIRGDFCVISELGDPGRPAADLPPTTGNATQHIERRESLIIQDDVSALDRHRLDVQLDFYPDSPPPACSHPTTDHRGTTL
jgi:hypothetical protein